MRFPFWRRRRQAEVEEEIDVHLQMAIRERIDRGESVEQARFGARKELGNLSLIMEVTRAMWGTMFFDQLCQDIKHGLRMIFRAPVFTLVAVLSLALGIGANTAIFSMIDAMLLKTLSVQNPEQLVLVNFVIPSGLSPTFSKPMSERLQNAKDSFIGLLVTGGPRRMHMTVVGEGSGDQTDLVKAEGTTGNFFNVLEVNAVAGRVFTEDDDRRDSANPVTVVSYNFWKKRFGQDSRIVGKKITLENVPFTIIGVAPKGFIGVVAENDPDLWFPIWMQGQTTPRSKPQLSNWNSSWLTVIGRLKTGVSKAQAQSELNVLLHQGLFEKAGPGVDSWPEAQRKRYFDTRIELQPAGNGFSWIRGTFRQPLIILMITVGLVLMIACANVANLLLARAASRQKEIAVRLSLGAGRLRLIKQLLTESIMLALLGGALGLVFSQWVSGLLLVYVSNGQKSVSFDLGIDARILGFTIAVSLITGILFGFAPALRATRFDLFPALKDNVGTVRMGRSRIKLDKVLVVVQVALSLFLLIGAGLFTRSLQNLRGIDFGFNPDNLLLFTLDTKPGYKPEQRINLYKEVLARIQTLPGVTSSSMSNYGLLGGSYTNMTVSVVGFTPAANEDTTCNAISVGPQFFETMDVPLLMGRSFNSGDNVPVPDKSPNDPNTISTPAPQLVVINETMAKYFFPNENPIGKQFGFGGPPGMEIVGVVKDSKSMSLREPPTRVFYSPYFRDNIDQGGTFAVRTANNPASLSATIQQTVRQIDKGAQILNVQTMQDVIDQDVVQERFIAQVAGFFGLFAVLLACIGLYGVMSYGVARRTREIGIRMALGARAGGVVWFVMRESVLLVLTGVAIGVPTALATTRFVATYLFGLSATDPVTIVAASLLLLSVALLAGYLPSRRASRIDPMVALRYD